MSVDREQESDLRQAFFFLSLVELLDFFIYVSIKLV